MACRYAAEITGSSGVGDPEVKNTVTTFSPKYTRQLRRTGFGVDDQSIETVPISRLFVSRFSV